MTPTPQPPATPSAHVLSMAGVDLPDARPPLVRVEAAAEVAVVLPRSRDPEREVYLDRCAADGVPVVVRPSGGGAVVLAPGTVAASVLTAVAVEERFPDPFFRTRGEAVAAALGDCGVAGVVQRGVSDLCLGERKIAGSAIRMWGGRLLYQVSILVGPRLELMERYLRMPSREPDYRRGRAHLDFVTSLNAAGFDLTTEEVVAAVRRRLAVTAP